MVEKRRTSARFKKEGPAKKRRIETPHIEEEFVSESVAVPLPTSVGANDVLPVIEKYTTVVDRVLQTIAERCEVPLSVIYSY